MPLPAARLRLSPSFTSPLLRNARSHTPLKQPLIALGHSEAVQTAVFISCTNSSSRLVPSFRSPHQWSHIVHRIRKPAALGASTDMATNSPTGRGPVRTHMGHSHSHERNHDNTYLTSTNRDDPGVRITRIGLYVNLAMAIGKSAGGYIFHSQASVSRSQALQVKYFVS